MATNAQLTCRPPYACGPRRARHKKPTLGTRLTTLAVALAALYIIFSGERWLLDHSPAASNELVVATCAVDAVFGDVGLATACTSAAPTNDKENTP